MGGAEGMDRYLQSIGLEGIRPNPKEYWGASHASPQDVAQLFAKLAWGERLGIRSDPEVMARPIGLVELGKFSDTQAGRIPWPAPYGARPWMRSWRPACFSG